MLNVTVLYPGDRLLRAGKRIARDHEFPVIPPGIPTAEDVLDDSTNVIRGHLDFSVQGESIRPESCDKLAVYRVR